MILQKRILHLFRFVKPKISQYQNLQQLEADLRKNYVSEIQKINQSRLMTNRSYKAQKIISKVLNLPEKISLPIAQRTYKISSFTCNNIKHFQLQKNVADNTLSYSFLNQQIDDGLPNLDVVPTHFSHHRGVSTLKQYQCNKKVAYIFNLPFDATQKQISQNIGFESIKSVQIKYCVLGLPSYAKVTFNSQDAISNIVLNNRTNFTIGERLCQLKTHFDHQKNKIQNRKLVIKGIQQGQQDLLLRLSKYGRIVQFDLPTFIRRNPSVQEVKKKYANSETLIRINIHKQNGTIQSEYYPTLDHSKTLFNNIHQFQRNLAEKRQKQQQKYKHRMRFAENIDIYEGRENEIHVKNMGFCIVTYSTIEQAQNCYFNNRYSYKMDLLKDKQQFQVDADYRKQILRFIDNQSLKVKLMKQTSEKQKLQLQQYDHYTLYQKLVHLQVKFKVLQSDTPNQQYEEQQEKMQAEYIKISKKIKQSVGKKLNSRSFDQIAELQLFGKVLPKKQVKPKLNIQQIYKLSPQQQYFANLDKISLDSQSIRLRDQKYLKRKNKRPLKAEGLSTQQDVIIQQQENTQKENVQIDSAEGQQPGDLQGKKFFSTYKEIKYNFRQRTVAQEVNYRIRYNEFIRDTINQYLGIFSQDRLSSNSTYSGSYLTPQKITFCDGTQFITEQDIEKVSQYHISFEQAQTAFQNYFKYNQIVKSKNINLTQFSKQCRQNQNKMYQQLQDVGIIKQVYEIQQGEDVTKKLNYLNSVIASFGQEFRLHKQKDGKNCIVRIGKLDNIYPLDKFNQFKKISESNKHLLNNQQLVKICQKYQKTLFQTGQIPEQARKAFNIPEGTSLDDIFQEFGAKFGINKKDFEALLNLQNFTQAQIQQDIARQIQAQKVRIREKGSKPSDFAKDPSNIQIKNREGFFKVSKFRQI